MNNFITKIKSIAYHNADKIIEIRRHLHQNPELSFEENKTTNYIYQLLQSHNIECIKGPLQTGVTAYIKGKNETKKTILLRADIDALPIEEKNNTINYASHNKGVMHACGHDAHTASMIGTILILNQLNQEFEGTVKIVFQPGEEVLPGGAQLLIQKGILNESKINLAICQHVYPNLTVGKIGIREGLYMASTDEVHIEIIGKGGHAALVNDYINPISIGANLIQQIQNEFPYYLDENNVPKNKHNHIPMVIAFGKFEALGATNIIPNSAILKGTIRTMNEEFRKDIKLKIKTIIQNLEQQHKAIIKLNIIDGYPCIENNIEITRLIKQYAKQYLGNEYVEDLDLRMTADDFAYFSQAIPSCYYRLGTSSLNQTNNFNLHSATFNIDEAALEIGSGLMAYNCMSLLQ